MAVLVYKKRFTYSLLFFASPPSLDWSTEKSFLTKIMNKGTDAKLNTLALRFCLQLIFFAIPARSSFGQDLNTAHFRGNRAKIIIFLPAISLSTSQQERTCAQKQK